jgi:glycosyltransferase involved in cell wall biosynthesis
MPRVLVIRYEGQPFQIRMSKVLQTMLDAGYEVDVLIPHGRVGANNVSREMGHDLSPFVRLLEFPLPDPASRSLPSMLLYVLSGSNIFGTADFKRYLHDLLARERYDLVWVKDTPVLPVVFSTLGATGHPRIPVVCDMYENMSQQLYDTLIRFGTLRTRLITTIARAVPRTRALERQCLPLCDRIFVVVEEAGAYLARRYNTDPAKITVVHNVEVLAHFDAIEYQPLPVPANLPLLTYVGGFGPHRGIETLLEATGILHKQGQRNFHLGLVGASPAELSRLTALCDSLGITGVVSLHGEVPHRQAMRWIKQSDVGVIPHVNTLQIRTTIPNKLFQYMASSVCTVVSDVGPLGRIARQTKSGLTFPAGDATALAAQLGSLIANPPLRRTLGANGRRATEQRYCWEIEGQRYALYLQTVAREAEAARGR